MSDIAVLGIQINSQQATTGAAALDKLAASAKLAGDATDKLSAATGKSETTIRSIQSMADRAGVSFGTMNARVDAASRGHDTFSKTATAAAQSVSSLANAAAGAGGSGSSGGSLAAASDKSSSALERLGNTLTRRVLFAAAANEVRQLAQYVWGLNGAIAATADSAQRSSISGGNFQGLQTAAAYKGVDNNTFNGAMVAFNVQVDLAKHGLGDLQTLLTSNGKTVSDTATTFGLVADLVKNAGSEAQKFSILQQAGLPATAAFVKYMEQGRDAITKQADAAGKLTDQQLDDAKKIDEAWQRGWTNFENYGKRAVVNTASSMSEIWNRGFGPNPDQNTAANKIRAGSGTTLSADSDVSGFYRGLGPTGTATPAKTTFDPNMAKQQNALEQQRLSILSPLAQVEDIVHAKELDITAARLNNIPVTKAQADALMLVTRAQAEMSRVNQQASLGIYDLAKAQQAAGDQLKAWVTQKLLDPNNPQQYASALTVLQKQLQNTSDTAAVAGSQFEQLKRYQLDSANTRTAFDGFATRGLDTFTNGLADAVTGAKSLKDAFSDMARSIVSDLVKLSIRSLITGPIAGALSGSLGGLFGSGGSTLSSIPKFAAGTNSAPGGMSIVGEKGPELVDLPAGARVISNDNVKRMGGSNSVSFGDTIVNLNGNADDYGIAQIRGELAAHRKALAGIVKQSRSSARFASTGVATA